MYDHSTFLKSYFENVLQLFTAIEYGKMQTHFFSALGPETEEKIKLAKLKFAFTCSFQKVIQTLALRGREKFDNSFYFKILGIV